MPYTAEFPAYFDDYEPEIEAKGYFADLTLRVAGGPALSPTFYDLERFTQECGDAFAAGSPYLSAPLLILVRSVTRATITAALEGLAAGGFADLLPDPPANS